MAAYCRKPYTEWKQALVRTFIDTVPAESRIVEIGPGHGRWTEFLLRRASAATLVDISQECLDYCSKRFEGISCIKTYRTDGTGLAAVADESIDFVWSFDSFVHMEADVVRPYLSEIARVLRPGGRAVIHHAAKSQWAINLKPTMSLAGRPGRVLYRMISQRKVFNTGCRADLSAKAVAGWARTAGLTVCEQTDSWGENNEYNVRLFRDMITVLVR